MEDSSPEAGVIRAYMNGLVAGAVTVGGAVAVVAIAYIAGSAASPPDIRGAL